jgi:hypothetical protein
MYQPKSADYSSWMNGAVVAIVMAILIVFLFGGRRSK